MKKSLVFTFIIAMVAIVMMTGCGNSEKEEMIKSRNYRKACELKDFITAYEIVDKLKERTANDKRWRDAYHTSGSDTEYEESKKKSDEAERYVILQESMLVLESEGSNGLMRVVAIAKEHNAESWLYPELLDVANKIGDTDLAERIQNIIKSGTKIIDKEEEEEDY